LKPLVDLEQWFVCLHPAKIMLILILLGPTASWGLEFAFSIADTNRLPYGLAFFEWARYEGDVFLALTVATASVYYRKTNMWPTRTFWKWSILFGIVFAGTFIIQEEFNGSHPGWLKVNPARVIHLIYFVVVASLLVAASRLLWFGVVRGHKRVLAIAGVLFFCLYLCSFAVDLADENWFWHHLQRVYPEESRYIKGHEL